MEEEIKILEEIEPDDLFDCFNGRTEKYNAIQNLLKRYKELEEEKENLVNTTIRLSKECVELEKENKRLREDVEGYSGLAKQIQEDYENRIDELENRDRFE